MKYLAVCDHGETVFLEDSEQAVTSALKIGADIKFYPIHVHPDTGQPILGDAVVLDTAPGVEVSFA